MEIIEKELDRWRQLQDLWPVVHQAIDRLIQARRTTLSDTTQTQDMEKVRLLQGEIKGLQIANNLCRDEIERLQTLLKRSKE